MQGTDRDWTWGSQFSAGHLDCHCESTVAATRCDGAAQAQSQSQACQSQFQIQHGLDFVAGAAPAARAESDSGQGFKLLRLQA